jgi:MYXO-CTERM domain-containing protein
VNRRSPAYALNQERDIVGDVPEDADSDAPPRWTVLDRTGRFEWHDHRAHWMAEGRPPQVKDPDRRTKVFDYRVPLRIGGRDGVIAGTLWWQPQEEESAPVAAFAGLGVLALLGLGAAVVVRRRRRGTAGDEAW